MCTKAMFVSMAVVAGVACGDSTGLTVQDLEGTWQATSYVFVNDANPNQTVDIAATQGATFTMTVVSGGGVATVFDNGQGGSSSDSGTLSSDGANLTLAGDVYSATRSGNRLTLVDTTADYDFDGNGSDEPASLRITLDRQ